MFTWSVLNVCRARSEPGGTRWRTGGEVKGKLAKGVGSQYSHATSERGIPSITQADSHTSAASSRLNWRTHRLKWTRPFQGKTKFGFCACAITFRTRYNLLILLSCNFNNFVTLAKYKVTTPWRSWRCTETCRSAYDIIYIYIYIYTHTHTHTHTHTYIYIYIYICCTFVGLDSKMTREI